MNETSSRCVGMVTIGQAPREDLVPEMSRWIGPVRILERGALDGLSLDEIETLHPVGGDYSLVTRLATGASVTVAKSHVVTRVQSAIEDLEGRGVEATVLLCTGEFPGLGHERPLLESERLLVHGVLALVGTGRVGVVCPLSEQRDLAEEKWRVLKGPLHVVSASPYTRDYEGQLLLAARYLRDVGVEYVVLDCMGYTQRMKDLVRKEAEVPVLLARSIVARMTAEIF